MKRIFIAAFALWSVALSAQNISVDSVRKHVYVLASDSLAGRQAATVGGRRAANYIVNELRMMGHSPIIEDLYNKVPLRNVLCEFDGIDPLLKDEKIVVVCHYDHIGQNSEGEIFPGANDNATSNAALLEIVRNWKPTKRSVIFMWSDGEEMGFLGSEAYANKHKEELKNIKLVIASEMLGHLDRTKSVCLLGKNFTIEGVEIVEDIACKSDDLDIVTYKENTQKYLGWTDTAPFWKRGVPVMVWFTDSMENYHQTTDTAQTIDYDGVTLIAKYIERSIRKFADFPTITPTEIAKEKK